MKKLNEKLDRIKAEALELTTVIDRLIVEVQSLRVEATSAEDAKRRHRLEMDLLNMKDFMWIRR
jgi:hypothetical protein